jgi:DNA-binding CsgD family transcriptional regulator
MKSVDMEREAFEESIGEIVRTTLLPALATVRKEKSDSIRNCYLDILEDRLLKLNRGDKDCHGLLLKLTPMEMKVCNFIQAGATSKEIAEALNLSVVTIQTHRRSIRRKLDLQNRNVNLHTFLNRKD